MNEELSDEVTSINSIYGNDTLRELSRDPIILALAISRRPAVSIRLEFPQDYPSAPPAIPGIYSVGDDVAKGAGNDIAELLRNVLAEIYTPGAPVIFDLIEESKTRLQQLGFGGEGAAENEEPQNTPELDGQPAAPPPEQQQDIAPDHQTIQPANALGEPPPWSLSSVITEKKSVFVARAAPVHSVDQAKQYLAHLLSTDKKVAKATHNITAWRIRGEGGVQFQDCDDDGESAAGGRVLHLLELMEVWGVMVVVTRWYGGVQLGPDRFRIINQTAREAVVRAGLVREDGAGGGGKKKGKK